MKYIDSQELDFGDSGHGYCISLDNPETRNSMTLEMGLGFHGEIHRLAAREPLPRVVIVTGKNGVFSSGGDFALLRSFADNSVAQNREFMQSFYRLFLDVRNMPFPVIAAVNGHAMGAALALALACDLRYFTPTGKYALNFVKLGFHPGMGSSFLIKDVAGMTNAQDLLLTGMTISGQEAHRRGICHGLFAAEDMEAGCLEVARSIAEAGPLAVRLTKRGLYRSRSLEETLAYESESQATNFAAEDFQESLRAISEKRKPRYQDA